MKSDTSSLSNMEESSLSGTEEHSPIDVEKTDMSTSFVKDEAVVKKCESSAPIAFGHLKSKVKSLSTRSLEPPLKMPFELPRNYPPIVMADLHSGKLGVKARSKFISSIASAIFKEKSLPLRNEYDHIGQLIIKQYPFLKSSSGTGYVRKLVWYSLFLDLWV